MASPIPLLVPESSTEKNDQMTKTFLMLSNYNLYFDTFTFLFVPTTDTVTGPQKKTVSIFFQNTVTHHTQAQFQGKRVGSKPGLANWVSRTCLQE